MAERWNDDNGPRTRNARRMEGSSLGRTGQMGSDRFPAKHLQGAMVAPGTYLAISRRTSPRWMMRLRRHFRRTIQVTAFRGRWSPRFIGAMIVTAEESGHFSDSAMLCALLKRYFAASYTPPDSLADLRREIRAGLAARDLRRVSSSCDLWLGFDPKAELLEFAVDSAFAAICNLEAFRGALVRVALVPPLGWHAFGRRATPRARHDVRVGHNGAIRSIFFTRHRQSRLSCETRRGYRFVRTRGKTRGLAFPRNKTAKTETSCSVSAFHSCRNSALSGSTSFNIWRLCRHGAIWPSVSSRREPPTWLRKQPRSTAQIAGAGWAAVDCYQHARMFVEAERETRRCIAVSPDATAYRRLAEVLYKQERIPTPLRPLKRTCA